MSAAHDLPKPECRYGYTSAQIERIMGIRLPEFNSWMRGQTGALCDGREYDYHRGQYVSTGCGPHWMVVYRCDVEQFLKGRHA